MTKLVKFALVLTTVFFAVVLYLLMDGTLKTGYEIAQGIGILEHIVAFIVFATISYNVLHLKKPINPVFGCILLVLMVVSVGWSINAFTTDLNALYGFNENGEKYGQAERREKERQEREQQRQEQQQQRQEAKQRYLEEKYADVDDRIAADSNDVSVIVEKGDLLRYDVRWSEAVKEYEKALSLDSVNFGALFGLGEAYCDIKDYRKANGLFKKAHGVDSARSTMLQEKRRRNGLYHWDAVPSEGVITPPF